MDNCIEIAALKKSFGNDNIVLKGVSFGVKFGEMVSIMGPSGSGKSTLLNMIGLLDKPDSGEYKLMGNDVANISEREMSRIRNEQIGFIFQQFNLINEFSALENVMIPMMLSKGKRPSKKQVRQMALDVLEKMGLKGHEKKKTSKLSGGEQQRVAIARALVMNPDIILADEPTGALDQKTGSEIMNILVKLNELGKTVIIVTHDSKVAEFCNRNLELLDGELTSGL